MESLLEVSLKMGIMKWRKIHDTNGGGEKHAECELALLANGSRQKDLWGADWMPYTQTMAYESIINIRPSQNNRSMIIQDPTIRERVTQITQRLIGGYEPEIR